MTTLRSHDTVMSEYQQNSVAIEGQGTLDPTKSLPVSVINTPAVSISGTPTVVQGTAAAISATDGSG